MFERISTTGGRERVLLEDQYAGPMRSSCWVIGGGPSLAELPCAAIAASTAPKFAINLAGTRLIRPQFWTSYDPTVRFHRSIYLDAGIVKFVHRRRAMDVVPGTTFKVCDCPATYVFDRDAGRTYESFPRRSGGIVDWRDSLVQGLELAYRLGFRRLLLGGCEMQVRPSSALAERARLQGVERSPGELLGDFFRRCVQAGVTLGEEDVGPQYHFDEAKSRAAAVHTDAHYFRVAQWLRLSRRSLGLAGLELVSVTPGSRLNDYFPYLPVEEALAEIAAETGDPSAEETRGLYTEQVDRSDQRLGPMRDFPCPSIELRKAAQSRGKQG